MLASQQSTRMQDHLQATLLNLLVEKPLEKITTGDLANAAKVDRSTFYRYYHNKFELLADTLKQSLAPYIDQDTNIPMTEIFNQLIFWLNDNRKIVKNIVINNSSFNFYQEIIRLVTDMMKKENGQDESKCNLSSDPITEAISNAPNPEFAIEAFATSIVGTMMAWLNHPEMDAEEMQAYLEYTTCTTIKTK